MERGGGNAVPKTRGGEVVSPRLKELLEKGLGCPLVLMLAPAGSGKTTLAACFARMLENRPGWRVAWASGRDVCSLEKCGAFVSDAIARCEESVLIVIDDAHIIEEPAARHLEDIASAAPDGLHLLIAGRRNPGLRLHQLRMEGLLTEIGRKDLAFGVEEVARFFRERQVPVSAERAAAIAAATNGWAAGLQMIALLPGDSPGAERLLSDPASGIPWIADFLREEVLSELDAEDLSFVRRTCLLDLFNAELCATVSGKSDVAARIDRLEKLNLVISVSSQASRSRSWYRYHPLFVENLRQGMFADISADEKRAVAKEAVSWFEAEGCYGLAIKTALSHGEYRRAFDLVSDHLYPILTSVDSATLPKWVEDIPRPEDGDERLYFLVNAWANFISGKTKRAGMWLRRVEELSDRSDPLDARGVGSIYRAVKVGVMVFSGEYQKALETGALALDNLGGPQLFLRCTIMHNMAEALLRLGRYEEAREFLARARVNAEISGRRVVEHLCAVETSWIQYADGRFDAASNTILRTLSACSEEERGTWPVGLLHVSLARIYVRWGETDKAASCLEKGCAILGPTCNRDGYVETQVVAAERLMAQRRMEDAHEVLVGAYEMAKLDKLPRGVDLLAFAVFAENLCLLGQYERALSVLDELRCEADDEDAYFRAFAWLVESHVWLFREELLRAEESLRRADALLSGLKLGSLCVARDVASASLMAARGEKPEAVSALASALGAAAEESYVFAFILPLPYVESLLYEVAYPMGESRVVAAARSDARAFARKILEGSSSRAFASSCSAASLDQTSKIELSNREREIYELLKQGKTRKQISEELGIQLNTTRTHIRNIYQKTGIHDRSLL